MFHKNSDRVGRLGSRCLLLLLAALPAVSGAAPQATPSAPKYYQQPDGWGSHRWGDPISSFNNLPLAEPLLVESSIGGAAVRRTDASLIWQDRCDQLPNNPCAFDAKAYRDLPTLKPRYHLVLQYRNEKQGFRAGYALLHPVTHFFCVSWIDRPKRVPDDLGERLRYCGVRLDFQSETEEQLASLPEELVTTYEHVLRHLLRNYGPPVFYRGRVIVRDADKPEPALRDFKAKYRWCTDLDPVMAPKCDVRMSLRFDKATGVGSLLIAAPDLADFAASQRASDPKKNSALYEEIWGKK